MSQKKFPQALREFDPWFPNGLFGLQVTIFMSAKPGQEVKTGTRSQELNQQTEGNAAIWLA